MTKCQYICRNVNRCFTLQNIRPNRHMGSRFMLPRFNVIFDIYVLDAVSTYILARKLMQMSCPVSREE